MKKLTQALATLLLLISSSNFTLAQTITLEPLNGPRGMYNLQSIATYPNGLLVLAPPAIYSSTNNGASFEDCSAGLPLYIYDLKLLESPSGELYAYFLGKAVIFKFIPASNSWEQTNLPTNGIVGYDAFDFDPQGRLWVSGKKTNGAWAIYYSDDQGQTLVEVPLSIQIPESYQALQLETFNDENNLMTFKVGQNLEYLYHFTKAGEMQKVLQGGDLRFIKTNPYDGIVYCKSYRSIDRGKNWTFMSFPSAITDMLFEPNGKTWVQSWEGMYWSTDKGLSWTQDTLAGVITGQLIRSNNGDYFNLNNCSYPNLGHSSNNGQTWNELSKQFFAPFVNDMTMDAAKNLYAETGRWGYTFEKSSDGGVTWDEMIFHDSIDKYVYNLATRPDGSIMASTNYSEMYRSFNNGADWEKINNVPLVGPFIAYRFIKTDYYGNFYVGTSDGRLFKSSDFGNSWQSVFEFHSSLWSTNVAIHPNGDIYSGDGVYQASSGNFMPYEYNGQSIQGYNIVCSQTGETYWIGNGGGIYNTVCRILPNSNYQIETVSPSVPNSSCRGIAVNSLGHLYAAFLNGGLYRSYDQGDTWEKFCNVPYNVMELNNIYIGTDQHVYAYYRSQVIHKSSEPTAYNNLIHGHIWLDNNDDCLYNPGEEYQSGIAISASGNQTYTSFSGHNGKYFLSAPDGSYSVKVKVPNALYEPCGPAPVNVTLDGGLSDSALVNLPIKAVAQCPYLHISLSTSLLRRCFNNTYIVQYKNEGTATATGAYVTITLDDFLLYQSSTLPVSAQNGQTYTFQLGDIAPGASGSFQLEVKVSCDATLGQQHCVSASIFPNDLCLPTLPIVSNYRECRENIGSFDPNDKQAYVNGQENPGYVLPNNEVEYLIRFQNTGTDTAFRVVVEDRFSSLFDLSSFTPIVSSHPYRVEVKDQNTLRFIFENILLPDSNINEAASHGFLKFKMQQIPDVPLGMLIKNHADIYFDFNAAVRTNETGLVVGTVRTKAAPETAYAIAAYPNPFGSNITFEVFGQDLPEKMTLRLFDALGRQARRVEFSGRKTTIRRETLDAGIYYYLMETDGRRMGSGTIQAH
jgi:photosystem II stability/assembly factor-like uncharacterized protein